MCGFVGQFHPEHAEIAKVMAASALLSHRGPDDSGSFTEKQIAFGFRRLSILDLSPAGHQPMSSPDGKITIMHNGEIYNYIELRRQLENEVSYEFRSQTDTEVIIAAYRTWGVHCFEKFNGMWAIAIWDSQKQELILSRDRFGEKPLYYTSYRNGWIFGSEIKALLKFLPQTPDPHPQVVCDYLSFGFHDHGKETFFQGIHQLLPAHYARITRQRFETHRYWRLEPRTGSPRSLGDAADEFRHLFTDSVRLRLRSDVPIGTCLSGGLDSSSIALTISTALKSESANVTQKTFTAASENPRYDERKYSRLVNEMSHAEQNEIFPQAEEFRRIFPDLLWHQEEPFLSLSIFAQWEVMKRAHDRGVTVILDGQGGDEILAGYIPFFASFFAQLTRSGRLGTLATQFKSFMRYHRHSLGDIIPTYALYLLPRSIGIPLFKMLPRPEVSLLSRVLKRDHLRYPSLPHPFKSQLKNHLYRLLTHEGLRALLHYEDRNAMAFSIESRVPFLDHRLAEFTLSLPDQYLIGEGDTKRLLRESMKGVLPESIRLRREKMGFVVPQREWMRGALAGDIRALLQGDLRSSRFVDRSFLSSSIERFMGGDDRLSSPLWRVFNLEQWMKRFYS